MPISTLTAYLSAPRSRVLFRHRGYALAAGTPASCWTGFDGASGSVPNPTTAVATNNATAGAICAPGASRIVQITGAQTQSIVAGDTSTGVVIVADRLSHQGGLVGNSTSTQTTNLPTAALTRYTSGEGVWIALENYVALGGTQTTATVSYTNQAGTAGRTGTCQIGGGSFGSLASLRLVALQAGDTGARSVESVTLTATTGVAGNFGVTLFRPLVPFPFPGGATGEMLFQTAMEYLLGGGGAALPRVDAAACLWLIHLSSVSTFVAKTIEISFIEDV